MKSMVIIQNPLWELLSETVEHCCEVLQCGICHSSLQEDLGFWKQSRVIQGQI